jgi:hypothetical protein
MAKFKGIKWAQILTLMTAIAVSINNSLASAKAYADGLISELSAGQVSFSSSNFQADKVSTALEELFTAVGTASSNAAVSISTSVTSSGMLRSYTFSQGGTTIGTIDIPKDYVNNIIGIVSQDGSGNSGVFLKVNTAPTGETASYEYVDVSGLVEYVTSGSQVGDMIYVSIDPSTHEVTATITDGTITKAKLVTAVQTSLGKADTAYQKPEGGIPSTDMTSAVQTSLGKAVAALQDADFEWASDNEVNTAWASAMTAAQTPAQSGE